MALSRDPLAVAAAAIRAEGFATKPCSACFAQNRELVAPDVYVARAIAGAEADRCFLVYQCPKCGTADHFEIPPHLLLATNFRLDALGRVTGDAPFFFYSRDADDTVTFWLDPNDGEPPVKLGWGALTAGGNVARAVASVDWMHGGSGERPAPSEPTA